MGKTPKDKMIVGQKYSRGTGMHIQEMPNGYTIFHLHYKADPIKDEKWIAKAKQSCAYEELWQQEMELDFIAMRGLRVYPEFTVKDNVSDLKYDPYRPIWRAWDFGYHHPMCVWMQVQHDGTLHILAELQGTDTIIEDFAATVLRLSHKCYKGCKFMDAGDPAVKQKSDKNKRTTADILRTKGIRIHSRKTFIDDGVHLIRSMCRPMPDGHVRFKVDRSCELTLEAFLGGYIRNDKNDPIKDNYYDHCMDAIRYGVVIIFDIRTGRPFKMKRSWTRPRPTASDLTGY